MVEKQIGTRPRCGSMSLYRYSGQVTASQYSIQLTTLPTSAPGLVGGKTEPSSPSTNNLRAEVNEVRAANVTSSQGPSAPSSQWPELHQ